MGDTRAQEDLFKAICTADVDGVRDALEAGADAGPNLSWCVRFAAKGTKMATIFGLLVGKGVNPQALAGARREIYAQIQNHTKIKKHSVVHRLDSMLFVITEAENKAWNDSNYPYRAGQEEAAEEEADEQEVVEVEMRPASPEVVVVQSSTAASSPDNSVMVSPGNSVVHKTGVASAPAPPVVTVDAPAVPDKVSSHAAASAGATLNPPTTATFQASRGGGGGSNGSCGGKKEGSGVSAGDPIRNRYGDRGGDPEREGINASQGSPPSTSPTPESTTSLNPHQGVLLQKLLFSKEFSDVHFECPDGQTLFANKQILAAACPAYFKQAFSGHQAVTVFRPRACHDVMKAVLSFIYTGDMAPAEELMGKHCAEFLGVASEYQLPELKEKAAACMEKSFLTLDTLKDCLVTAHVNGLDDLKQACFNVVHSEGMAAIFGGPFVAGIVQEHPDLWMELARYIQEEMAEESAGAAAPEVQEVAPEPEQPRVAETTRGRGLQPKNKNNQRVVVTKNNKRVFTKLHTRKFIPEMPEPIDLVTPKRRKFAFSLTA